MDNMASYVVTEEDLAACDGGSPFVIELVTELQGVLDNYTPSLLPANCDSLVATVAEELAALLESTALQTSFNRLGGMMFDKDIRVICDFLSSITEWSLRGKFSRCSQMATLLCVDTLSEVQE